MNLAIVDTDVVGELFGDDRREAGPQFLEWLQRGDGQLTSGGKNWDELRKNDAFREWSDGALRFDRLRMVDHGLVRAETKRLQRDKAVSPKAAYESNDPHVIALARSGGARLLFSNDGDLHEDFNNRNLIHDPPGTVYTTRQNPGFRSHKRFTNTHRSILQRRDLSGKPLIAT